MIARRIENLLELDYPRDSCGSSSPPTPRPIAPKRSLCSTRASPSSRNPRGGKVAAQDRAVRETEQRDPGVLGRERDVVARRAAPARRAFADPDVAYVCGQLRILQADGSNREGLYWRYEMGVRGRRIAARLGHGRQRLDLRRAAQRLRRGRSPLRARPVAAVPDGAARPARGLRARGARLGEADAVQRDRVPPQGADVRALLADRPAREDAAPARPAVRARGLLHRLLRYGSGLLHVVLLATSIALCGARLRLRLRAAAQLALFAGGACFGCRDRAATTRS